jgi:hypothetical protein
MEEQEKNLAQDAQLSDDELKEVAGGTDVHKRRLEQLDNQTKGVDNVQKTRIEGLDARNKS